MLSFSLRVFINKRFLCASSRWRCTAKADPVNAEFLVKLLDIQYPEAEYLLKRHPRFSRLPHNRIIEAYTLCAENGISSTLILAVPNILTLKPFHLEQRILFYKELGCLRILAYMLSQFSSVARFSVRDYKERHLLPADHDVVGNILKYLPGTLSDVPELKLINDDYGAHQIHRLCMRQFLKQRLEFTDKQLDEKLNASKLVSFTSLSTLRQAIEILESEVGLPKEKIRTNIHLMTTTSHSIACLSNKLKEVGDINLKLLIYKRPKLVQVRVELLQERIDVLVGLGILAHSIATFPEILGLSSKTIIERVKELESISELKGYWAHPRMLYLVFYLKKVKKRLIHLREVKVRCISLHILTCGQKMYERWIEEKDDRTKGRDLISFLSYELGDRKSIHVTLKRHPLWCQIPLKHSYETFLYLKERNYSNDDILKNIHIVLYRRLQIEKELNKIDTEETHRSWKFTSSQQLAMCLYNIEKEHHFDGHGAWNCQSIENGASNYEEKQHSQYPSHTSGM